MYSTSENVYVEPSSSSKHLETGDDHRPCDDLLDNPTLIINKPKRKRVPLPPAPPFQRRKQTAIIANLPIELLTQIFQFILRQLDLHTLCGVCFSFNQTATRFLYRWPKFKDTFSWAQFILSLTQLSGSETKESTLGSLVQVLDVSAIMGVALSAPERVVPIIKPTAATKVHVKLVVKDASDADMETTTPTTNAVGHAANAAIGGHHNVDFEDDDDDAQITAEEFAVWQAAIEANNDVNLAVNGNHNVVVANPGLPPVLHLILQQQQQAAALANNNNGANPANMQTFVNWFPQWNQNNHNAGIGNIHHNNHNGNHHHHPHPFQNHHHFFNQQPHNPPQPQHRVRVTRVSSVSVVERCTRIQISASSLKDLAEKCPDLLVLNLANSAIFPDTYLPQINAYLSRLPYQPQDHIVRISITEFDAMKALILGCKKLLSLDLRGGEEITDEIVLWIVDNAKNLVALNLGKCSKIKTAAAKLFFVDDPTQLKPQVVAALT